MIVDGTAVGIIVEGVIVDGITVGNVVDGSAVGIIVEGVIVDGITVGNVVDGIAVGIIVEGVIVDGITVGCRSGWIYYNNKCYNFNVGTGYSWSTCKSQCASLSLSMLCIPNYNK